MTAAETAGYKFEKWTDQGGATLSTSESYTFTMPFADTTINAVFVTSTQRRLNVVAVPSDAVQTLTGGGMYQPGTGVPVSVTPKALWSFSKWTTDQAGNNVVSTNASFTYTMPTAPTTLYAQIEVAKFDVTLIANPLAGGSPTVEGGISQTYNTPVTIHANAPSDGYCFVNWSSNADGTGIVSRATDYTFTMPGAPRTIYANYAKALFVEGFEGFVTGNLQGKGTLDMNYTIGDNKADPGNNWNPWWGTNPYNGSAGLDPAYTGVTAHSGGAACWSGLAGNGSKLCQPCLQGQPWQQLPGERHLPGLVVLRWMWADLGLALQARNYCDDPLSLVYPGAIKGDADYPSNAATHNFDETEFIAEDLAGYVQRLVRGYRLCAEPSLHNLSGLR